MARPSIGCCCRGAYARGGGRGRRGGQRPRGPQDNSEPAASIDVHLGATLSAVQLTLSTRSAPPARRDGRATRRGKTVVACGVIARRAVPTLVIVDRQPLVEQWRERLATHLGLARKQIGVIGGGRNRPGGVIDIAMIQSLARRDDLAELTRAYGFVVVDECHHVPAMTFERAVSEITAPAWLGLTATPYRRDGLEGLITMYCGPIRHRTGSGSPEADGFARVLVVHPTTLVADPVTGDDGRTAGPFIQSVFRGLVDDTERTRAGLL